MYLEFPLPFMPSFLKFDFGDVPALIAGFAFGPLAGILAEAIKCALFLFSGRSEAGIIGVSANFLTGASLVVAASLVYQRVRTLKGAVLALFAGTVSMTVTMAVANIYIFLPLWNIPVDQILPLTLSAMIPFNLIKGLLSSTATFLLYKRVCAWLGTVGATTQPAKARP
jgi:riboflavin transporter FmnP